MNRTINKELIGEILQQLYDSEIDFHMGWLWDGGIDFSLENNPHPLGEHKQELVQRTGNTNIENLMGDVVEQVITQFPNSKFTKWWNA